MSIPDFSSIFSDPKYLKRQEPPDLRFATPFDLTPDQKELQRQQLQQKTDQSVTAEYLGWLQSVQPRSGIGGNEAWNAGVAWARSQRQVCTRSHPHENMDAMCEMQTEIARLANENARLKSAQQQEPFGYVYEVFCLPECATEREWVQAFTTYKPEPDSDICNVVAVYTSPQPAQRKPLTDEEIGQDPIFRAGVRFAEATHGIKGNTRLGGCISSALLTQPYMSGRFGRNGNENSD